MSTLPPWLAIDTISVGYGRKDVVERLSITLAAGAIGCLLGPSGCGKTTVLRAVAGFEPLRAGRILLGGQVVSTPGQQVPPESRRIGMVFQDHALFPHLSVEANVGFGLRGRADAARRTLEMLETVGLAHAGRRYPHELSGGQQQRVALARALAPEPALLLLDEPFANLDIELRERLGGELRQLLKAAGTTGLMVTHDQHEAFAIADDIGIMSDGRIQQWDSAYNLYHRPANRFVADFVGQGVFLPGVVAEGSSVRLELGAYAAPQAVRCTEHGDLCPTGCQVDVLLRPDDVVHDDASPVTAEVLAKAFRGAEFIYTLRLDSGATVLSLVPSHHNHAIGERIGIRLELDHVVAFKRDSGPMLNCA
ncbi:ABC transporter ATP-binding protein [Aquabacterium sp.]|uniref:ABC transporter ATP-binding protein n=1 Tax=Aquabacterium sp. TaxID=1872578 RepID=UPI002B6FAB13|nr:ABC transporter ATP-binding protein [Aquabacterium sp.]HSW04891.1 ABC transporter ATP-binding protein [Aquabacterium sp.]